MSNGNQTLAQGKLPPVDQLTPVERKIHTLMYVEGKSVDEIADILGNKKISVQRRISTIQEKIRVGAK